MNKPTAVVLRKIVAENSFLDILIKNNGDNFSTTIFRKTTAVDYFASSKFRLKLKKAMHITWTKPSLNRQLKHVSIYITV